MVLKTVGCKYRKAEKKYNEKVLNNFLLSLY